MDVRNQAQSEGRLLIAATLLINLIRSGDAPGVRQARIIAPWRSI
jgi:hypothetical protein